MTLAEELELFDPLNELHKRQAVKLGLSLEEYSEHGKTVRPEDVVDECIAPPPLRSLNS